jgi:hypothetical protein
MFLNALARSGEGEPGLLKTWSRNTAAFLPFSLRQFVECRVFSPPCAGGERKGFRHSAFQSSATKIGRSQLALLTSQWQLFNSPAQPSRNHAEPFSCRRGRRKPAHQIFAISSQSDHGDASRIWNSWSEVVLASVSRLSRMTRCLTRVHADVRLRVSR